MFVKLTKKDGSPIWINAGFIVTVEPSHEGSIVVPVGDGLDYEVRETPQCVLAMLEGAPSPAIVPVPASDALALAPKDVSPEEYTAETEEAEKQPRKTVKRTRAKAASTESSAEKKPVKSRTRKRKPALDLSDEEIERLGKLAPKTLKKLCNTLVAQFKVSEPGDTVQALAARGTVTLEGERVIWSGGTEQQKV